MTVVSAVGQPAPAMPHPAAVKRPLAQADATKTMHAAKDFEAMALDQMLQPMFATLDSDPLFGGGEAERTLQPMLVTEMAKLMEARGGLGLSGPIDEKMIQLQEQAS